MTMQEKNLDLPLYARVHDALRQAIKNGDIVAGGPLPSEKDLEAQYGVSRITVRRALIELEREGLVIRSRGRQARVIEPLVSVTRTHIDDDLARLLDLVRGTEAKVLGFRWRLPDEMARARLEIEGEEPVLLVERLRSKAGQPILHTHALVPAWVGAKFDREALGHRTMLELLAHAGVTIAEAVQTMHAAPCPAEIAPLISLSAGAPCFIIDRLVRDDRGRPVQHLVSTFRWDSFNYRISSKRSDAGTRVEMAGTGQMGMPN